jgi:hypothetical protein
MERSSISSGCALPTDSSVIRRAVVLTTASLALLVFGFAMWPTSEVMVYSGREVAGISRYLESGYQSRDDEASRFVGTLGLGWQDLGLAARRTPVEEMAARLAQDEIASLVLVDADREVQARYGDGAILWVADPADGDS